MLEIEDYSDAGLDEIDDDLLFFQRKKIKLNKKSKKIKAIKKTNF